MSITGRAGVAAAGILSRWAETTGKVALAIEEGIVVHKRFRRLVAAGVAPVDAAATAFDEIQSDLILHRSAAHQARKLPR